MKRSVTMRMLGVVAALSLLIGGMALSPSAEAADWTTAYAGGTYEAPWVKDVEEALTDKEFRWVFSNDPRTPYPTVLKMLNEAAVALEDDNAALARKNVERVFSILEEGVRLGYNSQEDIDQVIAAIRKHLPEGIA